MANHEITEICLGCGDEYDARLHHGICPTCQHPSALFRVSKVNPSRQGLFHIPDAALIGAGFTREEMYDSDLSPFTNVKVVTFGREIRRNLRVEVNFYYYANQPGVFELKESSVQLMLGDEDLPLNLCTLADIVRFIDTLIKTIKTATHATTC